MAGTRSPEALFVVTLGWLAASACPEPSPGPDPGDAAGISDGSSSSDDCASADCSDAQGCDGGGDTCPPCPVFLCPEGATATDADGDGCPEVCVCPDTQEVPPGGSCEPPCPAVELVCDDPLAVPGDTDGDQCLDACICPDGERPGRGACDPRDPPCDPFECSDGGTAIDTDEDGCADSCTPGTAAIERPGIFNTGSNYFELETPAGSILKFHFGASNSTWGAKAMPLAGDFDGDGHDTVALIDDRSLALHVAASNDTDEYEPNGATFMLTGIPAAPPAGESAATGAVAGDWDGDGVDGVGVYHYATNTFYLRETASSGAPDHTVTLATGDGFPTSGRPVAGDFDGDGDDELGLIKAGVAFLTLDFQSTSVGLQFNIPGDRAVAGDWDGDGTDTLATFDPASNSFHMLATHSANAEVTTTSLGHAEPGYWAWIPLAGRWEVPATPVAGQGYAWPAGSPEDHGINAQGLQQAMLDGAFVANVTSALVVRHGALIDEAYYHGFAPHIAGNIKSVSKSVLSGLYGIAARQGLLALNDSIADHLPAYFQGASAEKKAISIADIMTMRAGLEWSEEPAYTSGMASSSEYVEYVLGMPMVANPGTSYNYSTGLTHVGSALLTEAAGVSTRAFARAHLFEPLGISTPRWDSSPEGYFVGGAEMWMRPRDLARFGYLYLNNGALDGNELMNPGWVAESSQPWVAEFGNRTYGLWWRERSWIHYAADDSFFAWGHGGQFLFIFPSKELIVVITSKWAVPGAVSNQSATSIFNFVDDQILTTVGD